MKNVLVPLMTGVMLFSLSMAMASDEAPSCSDPSINLREVAAGFVCRTERGFIFERVLNEGFGEAWLDKSAGVVWSAKIGRANNTGPVDQDLMIVNSPARDVCQNAGGDLPTRDDLRMASKHGFREVLPDMKNWFWSRSARPGGEREAYGYCGHTGSIGIGQRDAVASIRCIVRFLERSE